VIVLEILVLSWSDGKGGSNTRPGKLYVRPRSHAGLRPEHIFSISEIHEILRKFPSITLPELSD